MACLYVPQVAYQKIQRARLKASGGKVMQQKETEVQTHQYQSSSLCQHQGGGEGGYFVTDVLVPCNMSVFPSFHCSYTKLALEYLLSGTSASQLSSVM